MPQALQLTKFGNPVLRKKTRRLKPEEILSAEVQSLIKNMSQTLEKENYGVGIAAPQVGMPIAISVIGIKPTPNRPELKPFETVLINPEITKTFGEPVNMWEGCVSCGSADNLLFAQVPRFEKISLRWIDGSGKTNEKTLNGFIAHVAQHEVDHLNGILFVDKVIDTSSYMMADEYRLRVLGRH